MAGPFDVFMTGMQSANQLISGATQFNQVRKRDDREIEYVNAVTDYRKFRQSFLESVPQQADPDDYLSEWEQQSQEFLQGRVENIEDHTVRQRFSVFAQQEEGASHNRISQMAYDRRRSQGIANLERDIETARTLPADEALETGTQAIDAALSSAFIDEPQAERMKIEFEQEVYYDNARSMLVDAFNEDGYDAAQTFIQDDELRLNDQQRSRLNTTLNQLENAKAREFKINQDTENMDFWRMLQRGELTNERIYAAQYLSVAQREHWERRLADLADAEMSVGDGQTTPEGEDFEAQIIHDINVGKRDRTEINAEISQAYTDGQMISRTLHDQLLSREPLENRMDEWWDAIDNAFTEHEIESPTEQSQYQRRFLQYMRRQFYVRNQDGWRERENLTDADLRQTVDNFVREEIVGDRVMRMANRRDYALGDDPILGNIRRQQAQWNTAEDNLRAIDRGELRGVQDSEEYREVIQTMSTEHQRMLEALPQLANVRPSRIGRDGRPLFVASTPAGEYELGFFMTNPNTGEEYNDEHVFMYNRERDRWYPVPEGDPMSNRGGGSGTTPNYNSTESTLEMR